MDNLQPDLPRLLEGERMVNVQPAPHEPTILHQPSGLHELYRLARSGDADHIGEFGPVLASQVLEGHSHPAALHKYEAIFGRDSLRVALDLLDQYPKLARSTLIKLAELQGVEVDVAREEELGRIIHEDRVPTKDPMAIEMTKQFGWGWPYYGSVDATVEFIRTLSTYCHQSSEGINFLRTIYTGRDGIDHTMADAFVAAVNWIIRRLESNKEGLLEFHHMNPKGLENQAWKDSWDSYFHSDGQMANHQNGIASIEVQRVTYDALLDASEFYEKHFNKVAQAIELRNHAEKLRMAIMEHFWSDKDGGFFVLGTDRDPSGKLRQLEIKTSNMGHMLRSPMLLAGNDPEIIRRREATIKQLFSPRMLNVSGFRTLATDEFRFRPGSYHNGSVWLWDTYLISKGLNQHGYHGLSYEIERRLQNVVRVTKKFPEFARGDNGSQPSLNRQTVDIWDEKNQRPNRLEQPPQEVQAWTVAAILSMQKNRMVSELLATAPAERELEVQIMKSVAPKPVLV